MTKQKAIKESIKHWERMIEWVNSQIEERYICASLTEMDVHLRETWGMTNCPLCEIYFYYDDNPVACKRCPLSQKYGKCGYVKRNKWHAVNHSVTWKEWIVNANKLLRQLKSLLN